MIDGVRLTDDGFEFALPPGSSGLEMAWALLGALVTEDGGSLTESDVRPDGTACFLVTVPLAPVGASR